MVLRRRGDGRRMLLIDANALCEYANNQKNKTIDANDIMRFPTIDAEPVRHGYIDIRVINPYDGEDCYCSICGHWSLLPNYKWCPYCGAKMDGERSE